jgi:segregation and condensation protein A
MNTGCTVKLDVFEGPLDLLLHLIKRNEVQITDIPIALITDQYLATLEQLPELNLDGAGEYLVMAATLMLIKSRMLLPAEPGADGEVEEDRAPSSCSSCSSISASARPRSVWSTARCSSATSSAAAASISSGACCRPTAPRCATRRWGDLMAALREVLARAKAPLPHEILRPGISVGECAQRILARFALGDDVPFDAFFEGEAGRDEIIVTFLALLELIRLRAVRAGQAERFGQITVSLATANLGEAVELARQLTDTYVWGRSGEDDERQRAGNH